MKLFLYPDLNFQLQNAFYAEELLVLSTVREIEEALSMRKKRVTIYDLAVELGISPTTVSRALRGHQGISKETKGLVRKLAEEMEYRPNSIASSLRTKRTNVIGVLVPQINRAFMATFISGIEEVANKAGYNVLIVQSMDDPSKEIESAHSLLSSSVDGVVMSLAMNTQSYKHIQLFLDHHIPLVLADRVIDDMDIDKVVVDNFDAAFNVTEYLIGTGLRRIAHLAGSRNRNVYRDRKEGYLAALKAYKIEFDEDLLIYSDLSERAGISAVGRLMNLTKPPQAIFAANDTAAVSALMHLKELGYRIPEQISVVGFNNDPIASIVEPRLSTVEHPALEIGRSAAQRLIERISSDVNTDLQNRTFVLKTSLLIGQSSPPLRRVEAVHSNESRQKSK